MDLYTRELPVRCPYCGENGTLQAEGRINASESPELKAAIMDGSLFLWNCPKCGHVNLAVYPLLYHDPSIRLMIWLRPEGVDGDNAVQTLASELDGYTLRSVREAGSLMEKVKIFDAGLDDVTMEMVKYVTRQELSEAHPDKVDQIQNVPFKFFRVEGADNEIVLTFPMDGQMQRISVGFNVYEDCAGILRRNTSIRPDPGFAVVDSAWLGKFFG